MIALTLSRRFFLALLLALSATPVARGQAGDTDRRAMLTVRLHPNANLTVDGNPTRQTGDLRRFYSPPLEPNKKYYYSLTAEWMPGNNYETYTVTRTVHFKAGDNAEVDLRKADPKQGDSLFIRFVPSPPPIVDAMMKLANVGEKDVVYDLGCGNGTLVIAAVKKYHAKRGVGIDIDPKRIEEAKANAKKAGVEDKVEFRQQNVLKVKDYSEATVVLLYMSDDLNLLLRPKLREQLKPGARIVSHRFTMGDWKPDKTEIVDLRHDIEVEKNVHLWTIGKNHSGK